MKPLAALFIVLLPVAAAAQEPAAAAQTSGPMIVQRMHSTFLVAPDFKISRVDGHDARIAGVYGGILFDQQWLVGAGGYWLTNGSSGRSLGYGGGIVGWTTPADRAIGFSVRSLIGWGEARLTDTLSVPEILFPDHDGFGPFGNMGRPGPTPFMGPLAGNYAFRFHQQFFVAEPQANVTFRVASWGRIEAGAGYRAIAAAGRNDSRLRGATASLSLQVGNF